MSARVAKKLRRIARQTGRDIRDVKRDFYSRPPTKQSIEREGRR